MGLSYGPAGLHCIGKTRDALAAHDTFISPCRMDEENQYNAEASGSEPQTVAGPSGLATTGENGARLSKNAQKKAARQVGPLYIIRLERGSGRKAQRCLRTVYQLVYSLICHSGRRADL
jgi:hypothetical protein